MSAPKLVLPGNPVFNSFVKRELDNRQNILQGRLEGYPTSDVLLNHVARAPWIKMMSSVEINADRAREFGLNVAGNGYTRELASQNVLTSIIGTEGDALPYGYEISNSYGIRPQPGITSMNIISHNRFGSLRTMSVEFVCWDAVQLDILEMLYMRPGFTVLVEWGHSTYYSGLSGTRNVISGLEDQFFGGNLTKHQITAAITKFRRIYNGNYDGFFGFIKNFSWSLRQDGGYDCKTELVGLGELAESIPVMIPVPSKDLEKEIQAEFAQQQFEEALERFNPQDNTSVRLPGTSQAELDALRRSFREGTSTVPLPSGLPTPIQEDAPGIEVRRDVNLETNINDTQLGRRTITFRDGNGNLQTIESKY